MCPRDDQAKRETDNGRQTARTGKRGVECDVVRRAVVSCGTCTAAVFMAIRSRRRGSVRGSSSGTRKSEIRMSGHRRATAADGAPKPRVTTRLYFFTVTTCRPPHPPRAEKTQNAIRLAIVSRWGLARGLRERNETRTRRKHFVRVYIIITVQRHPS